MDLEIPRQLVCDRDVDGAVRHVRRQLGDQERLLVEARAAVLASALQPFGDVDVDQVRADLAAMFGGFRYMRQADDAAEATLDVTLALLRDFPGWAIGKACANIVRDRNERRFAPNDTEILDAVTDMVSSYRRALREATSLLAANVEQQIPKHFGREYPRTGLPPRITAWRAPPATAIPPERLERLRADLAERKARNQARLEEEKAS